MKKRIRFSILLLGSLPWLLCGTGARAQTGEYIGFIYPAGGLQGTTVQVRLGGQRIDGVHQVLVSGEGVEARVVEYWRRLANQDLNYMRENLKDLKRDKTTKNDPAKQALMARINRDEQAEDETL